MFILYRLIWKVEDLLRRFFGIFIYRIESSNGDVAHYGMTDFYPEIEKKLRFALFWKIPFILEGGSKKELVSVKITRDKLFGEIDVQVFTWMDEGLDLVMDEYDGDDEIPEDTLTDIEEEMGYAEIESETDSGMTLAWNASLDEITDAIDECFLDNTRDLECNVDCVIDIMREHGLKTNESYAERNRREDESYDSDCGCTDCNTCDCECWNEDNTDA